MDKIFIYFCLSPYLIPIARVELRELNMGDWERKPLENLFRFEQSYGCVNLICNMGFEYQLEYLNYTVNRNLNNMD